MASIPIRTTSLREGSPCTITPTPIAWHRSATSACRVTTTSLENSPALARIGYDTSGSPASFAKSLLPPKRLPAPDAMMTHPCVQFFGSSSAIMREALLICKRLRRTQKRRNPRRLLVGENAMSATQCPFDTQPCYAGRAKTTWPQTRRDHAISRLVPHLLQVREFPQRPRTRCRSSGNIALDKEQPRSILTFGEKSR